MYTVYNITFRRKNHSEDEKSGKFVKNQEKTVAGKGFRWYSIVPVKWAGGVFTTKPGGVCRAKKQCGKRRPNKRRNTIMAKITINDLMEAGCHFGHQTRRWNPKMKEYVYGAKNGISIIDLTKTMHQIANACNFLSNVVAKGGELLFVGTKRQAQEIIRDLAEKTGMFYVAERWMGGTLTNNVTIRKSIAKMYEIDKMIESGELQKLKKKELSMLTRDNQKLHRNLDGIAEMKRLPAALVVIDVCHDDIAVREAAKLNIPIVAIVDTNADPDLIDYPVVANDDAVKSLQVITDVFRDAILTAKEVYNKQVLEAETAKGAAEKIAAENAEDAEAAPAPRKRAPRARKEAKEGEEAAPKKRTPRKSAAKKEVPESAAPSAEDVAAKGDAE